MIDLEEDIERPASFSASRSNLEQDSKPNEVKPRHGWKEPPILLQQEKFEHRIMAFLKAEGKSNEEIAKITGFSDTAVGYIVKQPSFEAFILELIAGRGGRKVEEFIDDKVMPALQTVSEIMEDKEAPKRDRIACAKEILDRKYGRPNQPMTVTSRKDSKDMTLEEVDEQLAQLRRKKSQMGN